MTRTLRVLALLVVAFAVLTAGTGRAETPEAPAAPPHRLADEAPALHALLDELLEGRPYAGLSLGVSFEGERWTAARGWADVTKKRKATERTSYRMASVTKMFTAVAVMQLVEQGRIDLDEDIRTYVPSFPKKAWTVTPRHLLGHLGGISHYRDREKETHFHRRYTTAESLAIFQDWALEAPPGDQYVYTSYGYNLLGAAIERASGQSYAQYLRSRVFRPVEMTSSMVEDLRARDRTWARGYRMLRARVRSSEQVDISSRFAGGGTRSTVVDMLRFGEGLLAEKLLRRETLRRMQLPMATNAGEVTDYGMGMAAYPLGGRWVTAHAGAQPETSTLLMIFPAEQLVIAVAQNLEGA